MSSFQFKLMNQKIPNSKKTEEWHKEHVFSMVESIVASNDRERTEEQLRLWKKTLCIFDKQEQQNHLKRSDAVTKPYGTSLGIEWMDYPLIESKIEQFIGEYLAQDIKKKCYVLNKKAKSKKLDHLFTMIGEEIMREFNVDVSAELGFTPETENKDMELPENVEEFYYSDYKTESEEIADLILNMVIEAKKNKQILKDLYYAFLVQDDCIADVVEENGHPAIKIRNTFDCIFDWSPNKEVQTDPQFLAFNSFMSYNEIVNEFNLTDKQEAIVKAYTNTQISELNNLDSETGFDHGRNYGSWFTRNSSNILQTRVIEMRWISKKQIRAKVSINSKTGKEIYKLIDDDYPVKKNDNIKKVWVDEKRFIIMAGPDLVLDHGVMPYRHSYLQDPKKDRFLTIGLRRNGALGTNVIRSAAAKLEQLQDFASEALFEARLTMRRNNGKVMVYDAAQTPKQFLKGTGAQAYSNAINRVMHHAKKDQFLLINSADKSSRHAFNQFTALDMGTKGALQEIFNMLALIEDLASKFIGISPQREGQVGQYETTGGAERAVAQSTARSQIFSSPFEAFVQEIMEAVILLGKNVYEEGELVEYIFGDIKSKFFKVLPEYFQDDIGVYIGDGFKDRKKKAIIDRAAEQAFSQAQTPDLILTLTEVLNAEFASDAEKILKRGIASMQKLREENMKAEQENAKMMADATDRKTETEAKLKREGFENNKEVAYIYADNKTITDAMKNNTQKELKAADIEKEYVLSEQNAKSKEKV